MTHSEFEAWLDKARKEAKKVAEEYQREWEQDPDYDGEEFYESAKFWMDILRDCL